MDSSADPSVVTYKASMKCCCVQSRIEGWIGSDDDVMIIDDCKAQSSSPSS